MGNGPSLTLEICWDGREIAGARVDSARPVFASRLLEGRPTSEALGTVPRLFSVCRRSQAVAAHMACEFAERGGMEAAAIAEGELTVLAESALESLWWLLLEWPVRVGESPHAGELAHLRMRVQGLLDGSAAAPWERIAAELEAFLANATYRKSVERLVDELRTMAMPAVPLTLLPWLDARALTQDLAPSIEDRPDFPRAPLWQGAPAETGTLARMNETALEHPIASRVEARFAELATIPSRMQALCAGAPPTWVRGAAVGAGEGIAAVETARGTLVHAVAIEGSTVRRWRIVAPTEWNFHPEGAFARGLAGLPAASTGEAARAAERLACALDPCVEYRVAVVHA